MDGLKRLLSSIDQVNGWIGRKVSLLLYALAFLVAFEVIARYLFNRPSIWAFEMELFLFGAAFMLGGGYTLLHGSHVNVPIVVEYLPLKTKAILDLVNSVLFFFFVGILLWKTSLYAWDSLRYFEHSWSAWSPPIYPVKIAMALGVALVFIQGIASFIRNLIIVIGGGRT